MRTVSINPQKCFQLGIDPTTNWHSYPVNDNWLNEFKALLSETAQTKLIEHTSSSYSQKEALLDSLKIVYLRLTGQLNYELGPLSPSEKTAVLSKVEEDITKCTPGFHNRIDYLVQSFSLPKSIDDLLYLIRKQIVEKTTLQHTNEIHAHNQFFVIASVEGYGVRPIRSNDSNPGNINDGIISDSLKKQFKNDFNPLNLIPLLRDNLKTQLIMLGYTGKRDNDSSYTLGDYHKFQEYLCKMLAVSAEDLPINSCMVTDENDLLIDINWPFLQKILLHKLTQEAYLNITDQANVEKPHYEFLLMLYDKEEFEKLPTVAKRNTFQPATSLRHIVQYCPELITLFSQQAKFAIANNIISHQQVKELVIYKTKDHETCLMIAVAHQPTAIEPLTAFIQNLYQTSILSPTQVAEIIMYANVFRANCLLLAAADRPTAIDPLVKSLQHLYQLNILTPAQIATFTMQKIVGLYDFWGWNCLMFAASKQPIIIESLITFIHYLYQQSILSPNQVAEIVMQKDISNQNCLMLAAAYQPTAIEPLLAFVQGLYQQRLLSPTQVVEFLTQTNISYKNCLMIAATHMPSAIELLISSIQNLYQQRILTSIQIAQIIMQKSQNNENCLMLAAAHQPTAIEPLIAFLKYLQHQNVLTPTQVANIITQKSLYSRQNCLTLVARSQPMAGKSLLEILVVLYQHNTLGIKHIKNLAKEANIVIPPDITKKLLDAYIAKTEVRIQQGNLYRTTLGFWKGGFSAAEKLAAARQLQQTQTTNDSSAQQGELGSIKQMLRAS